MISYLGCYFLKKLNISAEPNSRHSRLNMSRHNIKPRKNMISHIYKNTEIDHRTISDA